MRLLVIRHAKAEERDSKRWPDDSLRPLAASGAEKFRRSAAGLGRVITPDILLTSPYTRARQTADILHEAAGWPKPVEKDELAGDEATVAMLVNRQVAESHGATVAIVGHEPTLSQLISAMVAGHPAAGIEMKTGAAALLEVERGDDGPSATLLWLAQPKLTWLMR